MPLLEVEAVDAHYGDFQALYGVSLAVEPGQVVAVIGANGAGKSTLMRTVVGLMRPTRGEIRFEGAPIHGLKTPALVARGIALVPEGRRLFASLTVGENLVLAGQIGRKGPWSLDRVFELFPVLKERRNMPSTDLSGGQQQMVAIGRALMSNPRLLLCDELSLGLAPIVVREIFQRLPQIVSEGTSVVIVEQDVMQAITASAHLYCLQEGRVALSGIPSSLSPDAVRAAYFGV
jgi:branched-chain amino acid transport system ATP-binding protein